MKDVNPLEDLFGRGASLGDIIIGISKKVVETRKTYTLKGDEISLEPLNQEGKSYMKIHFPNNQIVRIPDGTKGARVRYESPTDGRRRIINVAYLNGRCRIEFPE